VRTSLKVGTVTAGGGGGGGGGLVVPVPSESDPEVFLHARIDELTRTIKKTKQYFMMQFIFMIRL
jgi:hypothetical protein